MCCSVQVGKIYLFAERKGPGQVAGFILSALQVLSLDECFVCSLVSLTLGYLQDHFIPCLHSMIL